MKRKGLAMLLTLVMLLGMLPTAALAAGPEDQWETQPEQTVEAGTVAVDTSDVDLPDNEELFAGYVQQLLYPEYGISTFGNYGETALTTALDKAIYEQLKEKIQDVAASGGSTEFTLPLQDLGIKETWTKQELGVTGDWSVDQSFTEEVKNAIQTKIFTQDTSKIIDVLLADCPYELYWFDKTKGYSNSTYPSASVSGETLTFTEGLKFSLAVAQDYRDNGNQYSVSSDKIDTVTAAIATANKIVANNKGKSDYEKLKAYKDEICKLTEYNHTAADNENTPYGDPWQLIYVFDGKSDTTVVCEGYSKAFQYLCDQSQFTNAYCYTVQGDMDGGGHMWNIVKLDGKNYLVDVTNSDAGTVGADGGLFLDAPQQGGSMETGYTFTAGGKSIQYTYDEDSKSLYGESILELAETGYQQQTSLSGTVTIEGKAKIGEALAANTDGVTEPLDGSFTYQWYRDDTKIDGATEQTYIPVAADAGKTLKVEVMAENYSGSVFSNPTTAVEKKDAPEAPTVFAATEITDTSITVTENADWEYRLGTEGIWQKSNTFSNLTANTPYQIYVRVAETEDTKASEVSQPLSVTTKAPKTVKSLAITTQPTKKEYIAGESFDTTGMVVKATYDDGTTDDNFTGYTVVNGENLKKGAMSVTIQADGASVEVAITVKGVLTENDFTYTAPADLTYDGQPKQAQVQAKSEITGIGAITVKYNGSETAPTDAGTYTVTFDVAASADYAVATGLSAGSFTIAKATPTITAKDLSVMINHSTALGASIDPAGLTLSYDSKDTGIATVDQGGNVTGKAVGSTTITVSFEGDNNYNAAERTVQVTVTDKTPIEVTFTAQNESKQYTGVGYKLGEQFNEATVADGKTAKYRYNDQEYDTLAELPAVTTAGAYTVTAFYSDETYYGEQSATFTITKADQAQLTISSANTVTFGQTLALSAEGGSGTGVVIYTITPDTGSAIVSGNVLTPTKAGTVTVTATKAADDNYNETTATQTVTISKAEATEVVKTASGTVAVSVVGSVTLPAVPDGAAYGEPTTEADAVTILKLEGNKLTYTGGSNVKDGFAYVVTIPVSSGDNYNAYTITVTLTGRNKIMPTLTVNPINVTYTGKDVPASAIVGTAKDGDKTVSGKWSWGTGKSVPKNVADSGSYEVCFTPDDKAYLSGTTTVQVTIAKATPTGAPKYTSITNSGETLSDAGLTTTGGTFSVSGTVEWEQATTTEVTANTAYKWVFTPSDTANYNTLTGSITLWQRSTDSSSSSVSQPSTSGGTSTVVTDVNSSLSGSTASATISTYTMNTAVDRVLNAADRNDTDPVVVVSVNTSSRADSVKVTLPVSALETLSEHAYAMLTIDSDVAEVTLDSDAIDAVASQAGSMITLHVAAVDTSELTSRQKQAVGSAPVFDLSFKSGSTTISDFDGGYVTVTLPYMLKSGQTADGVVVWYMDNSGNLTACDTSYNINRRKVTFTTKHFSKYVIGYEEQEQQPIGSNHYSDVYRGAWYYDAVQFVTDKGLMNGMTTTRFSPDETTTRAMIVTILWRQAGSPSSGSGTRFDDVDPYLWYGSAVRWAAANNIVNGYGDGTFGPDNTITREQMAAILYRYAQYRGYSVGSTGSLGGFTDANRISDYATAACYWSCGRGIMEGITDTTLGPKEYSTRAQVATILMRFCNEYDL